jgi:amino acid adenylation domain-containing protein
MDIKSSKDRATFPLTPMQQGMLYHCLSAPRSGFDVEQVIGTLREPVELSAFRKAWQRLVDRHDALRMRFSFDEKGFAHQFPLDQVTLPIDERDWSKLSSQEQDRLLEVFLQEDRLRGFDPKADTLIRVAVFRLGVSHYRFVWTWWHGILDGRARLILLKELFSFYEVFRRGEDINLPVPRRFADFAEWLAGLDASSATPYWRDLLKGFTDPTVVGGERPLTKHEEGDFGEHEVRLTQTASSRLYAFVDAHGLTMNALVQGAWARVLSQFSGQDDVVFGTTRACRHLAFNGNGSGESIVGILINTLPIRVIMEPDVRVVDWLKKLRAKHIAMRPYEYTPIVAIQESSDVPADQRLFNSIVVFENQSLNSVLRSQGREWESRHFEIRGRTGYPLTLYVWGGAELLLQISNDRAKIDDETAERMISHLVTAIESMAERPKHKIQDVPLLPEEERQLMREWNATQVAYPQDRCVQELFEAQAAKTPGSIALVYEDQSLTYEELNRRANQLAHHLRSLGVRPGVLAGICVERSPEMVVGVLGVLKAGGTYVPLDPAFPSDRLAFMAEDAELGLIVTKESLMEVVPDAQCVWVRLDADWERITRQPLEDLERMATPEDLAYVLYTSGSTGKPKGVEISHRALTNFLWSMRSEPSFTERDVLLAVTTLSFDIAGLELFLPLIVGGRIELASRQVAADARVLRERLDQSRPTMMQATPATWRMLIEAGWNGTPGMTALCGGEGLPRELANQLMDRTAALWNMYGPTETTIWSSVQRVSAADPEITIGRPIANTEFYILDKNLQPVPVGVPGELLIGGDGLARGYRKRPELTEEKFILHPFSDKPGARLYRTGDLARYREDGRVVHLGRLDHQVKLRGFRIELGEIEAILDEHPAVQKNVVIARDTGGGAGNAYLAAYIVPKLGQTPTIGELRRFLQEKLPDYMIPSSFVLLAALPLTPNGKVDRRALPAPDQMRPKLESTFVAARTPTEETLVGIWREVLGVERVGIHDNFFELGGHSLRAIQIISRIQSAFDVELSLRALFSTPTVAGLATAITQQKTEQVDGEMLARMLAELEELSPDVAKAQLADVR